MLKRPEREQGGKKRGGRCPANIFILDRGRKKGCEVLAKFTNGEEE